MRNRFLKLGNRTAHVELEVCCKLSSGEYLCTIEDYGIGWNGVDISHVFSMGLEIIKEYTNVDYKNSIFKIIDNETYRSIINNPSFYYSNITCNEMYENFESAYYDE